jgi:hypothetical protein
MRQDPFVLSHLSHLPSSSPSPPLLFALLLAQSYLALTLLSSCTMIVATTVLRSLLPFFLGIRSTAAFSSHSLFLLSHRHTAAAAPASFLSPTSFARTLTQHNMSSSASDDVDIAANIAHVRQVIDDAIASSERKSGSVRLVAVSKTKPLELLQAAYEVRRCVS